jgi:putative thioredoxin
MARGPSNAAEVYAAVGDVIIGQNQEREASQSFARNVVEASHSTPVIVDFGAGGSGPSVLVSSTLDRVVEAVGGRVRLVRIDIDLNRSLMPELAELGLPINSIPTVAAFWQGKIVGRFQGALAEPGVKLFVGSVQKLAGSSMPSTDLLADVGGEDELAAREIDNILSRLEPGIAREQEAMDALLSRLRTTRIAA